MERDDIRQIVKETIAELKKSGLLKSYNEMAYAEVSEVLSAYYEGGETDKAVSAALQKIEADQYYKLIPLYFSYNYTIERIAEIFDVDVSTITRNKKRLCLLIYDEIQ